jgi:hypothetical protein
LLRNQTRSPSSWDKKEGARNLSGECQSRHSAENGKAESGGYECHLAGKEDAGHDDDQQIERDEIAFLEARGVNEGRNDDDVASNLQSTLPSGPRQPTDEPDVNDAHGDPDKEERQEGAVDSGRKDVLRPEKVDDQDQENRKQADTGQPA